MVGVEGVFPARRKLPTVNYSSELRWTTVSWEKERSRVPSGPIVYNYPTVMLV